MTESIADIPFYGLGTWKIGKDVVEEVVFKAIVENGVRHIDCASDYGNEVQVGRGIAKAIESGVVKREDLWITSKLWNTYHRLEHIRPACEKSLQDLQLSYLDLYLVHFPISLKHVPIDARYPPEWIFDPSGPNPVIELDHEAPMHKTWEGMEQLVALGLTKRIGVANFSVQLLMDMLSYAKIKPFCNQVELHPYLVQDALLDFCNRFQVKCVAFSPLGSASYIELGMDFGLKRGLLDDEKVKTIADAHGRTPAQVLLRWGVQRGTPVIPKSSSLTHLGENVKIFDFSLSEEEMAAISSMNRNQRFNDPWVYGRFMGLPLPIFA
ncbi:aldo/keto reductase [archaeon]|nr:MAG: aldo/keto reductase [archaeon]